jgi:hypothetical protein
MGIEASALGIILGLTLCTFKSGLGEFVSFIIN